MGASTKPRAVHAARPLQLLHLLLLRPSPDESRYAAYFYNRLDGPDVRMVSYHQAERSELSQYLEDVMAAVESQSGRHKSRAVMCDNYNPI